LKYIPPVRLALIISALTALAACDRSRADGPAEAYAAFSKAIQRGDWKAAYASLSQETQQKLAARAKEIAAASAGAIKDDPAALAFSGAPRPEPLSEVKLVYLDGDRAVLLASAGGRSQQVSMVRENSAWKVDLSAQGHRYLQ
jgi:hypothetical protein